MSPGDILLCTLYVLSGAALFVAMLRAICDQPPAILSAAPPASAPPAPMALPYFPYAARGGSGRQGSETTVVVCAICLDPLMRGQPCSDVPACRHTFHRDCVGAWVRSSNSCPLCRVKIVPPSGGAAAAAHDMV